MLHARKATRCKFSAVRSRDVDSEHSIQWCKWQAWRKGDRDLNRQAIHILAASWWSRIRTHTMAEPCPWARKENFETSQDIEDLDLFSSSAYRSSSVNFSCFFFFCQESIREICRKFSGIFFGPTRLKAYKKNWLIFGACSYPSPSFPCFLWRKNQKKRTIYRYRTPKSLDKQGKTVQMNKKHLAGKKGKGIGKERFFGTQNLALGNLQKCVGGFLLYKFWRILPGIFLEDFSGHFFPLKMRRKNPARKSAKKSGGSKIKIREKSVLPKAGPKNQLLCQLRSVDVTPWWLLWGFWHRGPAAVLFISHDACSDSIAKLFRACCSWGIARISRDM